MSVNDQWNKNKVKSTSWFERNIRDNYRFREGLANVIVGGLFTLAGLGILSIAPLICWYVGGVESLKVFFIVTGGMLAVIAGFWSLTWILTEFAVFLGFSRDFVSRPRGGGWPWWWNN